MADVTYPRLARGRSTGRVDRVVRRAREGPVEPPDRCRYRSGLSELIAALAAARTATEVADAVWWRRGTACGASGVGIAVADPDVRLLPGTAALDRDRDEVEQLRRRLRPTWLPSIAGAEVAVRHEPADGTDAGVGFYDVFATEAGVWRLVAGDVAGHGVDAAVLAGLARQAFRSPDRDAGPAATLGQLDQLVRDFGDPRCRMSAVCVDLTRRGRGFTLTAARAGHPPPLVLRGATRAVLSVDVPGGPLGAWPDPEPAELGLELQPGDALLLCAGRAGRGGLVGDPRFAAVLAGCAGRSPSAVLEHVGPALAERGQPVRDGTSLLVLRVRGGRTRASGGGLADRMARE
jgi:hypothetical protein